MKQQEISAEYVGHHGSDLMVANAARTSFGKESTWAPKGTALDYPGSEPQTQMIDGWPTQVSLTRADANLIRFLASGYRSSEWDALLQEIRVVAASNDDELLTKLLQAYKRKAQHWAPFGHPHLTLRMTLPLFLARQFVKHQIGGTWSEESRRYMSSEPSFWFPKEWHTRPSDIKQGSGGVVQHEKYAEDISRAQTEAGLVAYTRLLEAGVAPEEARTALTLNAMTSVTWTGSLLFWSRVANQRTDSHAQLAAQELGWLINDIVAPHYPVSWEALTN